MLRIKKTFTRLALGIEENFDALALALRKRLREDEPLQVLTYRSYGTVNRLYIKGRVLKEKAIPKSSGEDSIWKNLVSMYKRFESDEVPHARLRVNFQNKLYEVTSDDEGYFTVNHFTETPLACEDMWYEADVELIDAPTSFSPGLKSTAHVLIPTIDSEFGIISDIDDTIVKTSATDLLAMAKNTFFTTPIHAFPSRGFPNFTNRFS